MFRCSKKNPQITMKYLRKFFLTYILKIRFLRGRINPLESVFLFFVNLLVLSSLIEMSKSFIGLQSRMGICLK